MYGILETRACPTPASTFINTFLEAADMRVTVDTPKAPDPEDVEGVAEYALVTVWNFIDYLYEDIYGHHQRPLGVSEEGRQYMADAAVDYMLREVPVQPLTRYSEGYGYYWLRGAVVIRKNREDSRKPPYRVRITPIGPHTRGIFSWDAFQDDIATEVREVVEESGQYTANDVWAVLGPLLPEDLQRPLDDVDHFLFVSSVTPQEYLDSAETQTPKLSQ